MCLHLYLTPCFVEPWVKTVWGKWEITKKNMGGDVECWERVTRAELLC
jgi:hypothetical protein